jgi:predicted TIM-barrel enzyme
MTWQGEERVSMARRFARKEVIERLKRSNAEGKPILVACCGAGIIAKCAELAGADIIMTACTSKSRLMGLPTTAMGRANDDMMALFPEISNVVRDTPIIASLDASDPTRMDLALLLDQAAQVGYSGVLNYPTLGPLLGHERRFVRESVGLGFAREVEMMRIGKERDLFTISYAFNPEDARLMAEAGVDCLVAHVGTTGGGLAGSKTTSLSEASEWAQQIIDVTKSIDPDIICLSHGGPFSSPEDTRHLYEHTDAVGFVGASSIERIPIERAIRDVVTAFKSVALGRNQRI